VTRRRRITIAIAIGAGAALIAYAITVDSARSQEMPPIEQGIATAVALRGLRIQETPTLPPPPTDPIETMAELTGTPTTAQWDRMAQCESGGNWSINTGNGYYGGLQFALTSWRAVGGTGYPHQHSRLEQIYRADRLWLIQGWGAWPACSRKLGYR